MKASLARALSSRLRGRSHRAVRLAVACAVLAALPGVARATDAARLMAVAQERGTVRVLARLDVATTAEARLPGERVAGQRQAIRAARGRLAADLGGTAWRTVHAYDTVPYVALELSPAALTALTLSGAVRDVQEDRLEKVMLPESVPIVQADAAWAAGFDGTDWVVAVLDTGVFSSHPFLAGKVVEEACFSATRDCPNGQSQQFGPGAAQPCAYAPLTCAHGTHVAGIAAGRGPDFSGTARGANIIAVQVFSRFQGSDCDDDIEDPCAKSFVSDTVAALEYVFQARERFKIAAANLSLGGGTFESQAACDAQEAARKAVIDNLRAVGIATVAAAGNEGCPGGRNCPGSALSAPGCVSSVISVGAVSKSDEVAPFSNSASFLSLLAPGTLILSSVPPDAFEFISGTSESTPHVAGAFAILSQRLGRGDVDTVLAALQQTGVPITDPRNGVVKPRIAILDALEALPAPGSPSGLQITPDGARTLISKDVSGARWAIAANPDDDTATGIVFSPSGDPPQFVWCVREGDDGNPDPRAAQVTLSCSVAQACPGSECPVEQWQSVGTVQLPGSFFLPPPATAAAGAGAAGAVASPAGTSGGLPSGLQITPDRKRTLISKDVDASRWAITQNPDGTVTGNVFFPDGGEPKFVFCERVGDDGNPDPEDVQITFSCSLADRCLAEPCLPSAWSVLPDDVVLPGSFFLPR